MAHDSTRLHTFTRDGLTSEVDDGGPVGVAYYAPERMTEGTWNLYAENRSS